MPIAWYIVPYKRIPDDNPLPGRYCAMKDEIRYNTQGDERWAETEVLGNVALVKVSAGNVKLSELDAAFYRFPVDDLDADLSGASVQERNAIRQELLSMGYQPDDINDSLGPDLGDRTLREILMFAGQKRLKPRYDVLNDEIVLDGPVQKPRSIQSVDEEVQ